MPARLQDGANPAIIPRNHVMVGIISEAEQGNYQPLHRCAALRAAVGSSCLQVLLWGAAASSWGGGGVGVAMGGGQQLRGGGGGGG